MRSNDIKSLRQILREAMNASGRRRRDLEVVLGLGRGNLERLTDGTLEIKVRHLLDLAELLGVPPTDFIALGCPETMARAHRRLMHLIAPGRPADGAPVGAAQERPMSRAEVAALVREELRSALQGMGAAQAPGGPAPAPSGPAPAAGGPAPASGGPAPASGGPAAAPGGAGAAAEGAGAASMDAGAGQSDGGGRETG